MVFYYLNNCFCCCIPRFKVRKSACRRKDKLQNTRDEMKTLHVDIIPICSYCKQIKDDEGIWRKIEKYIREHSEAVFSHGICPDCMKKYYPNIPASVDTENE